MKLTDTRGEHEIALKTGDFSLLHGITGGKMEIAGNFKTDFARLQSLGLVRPRFDYSRDWPVAVAQLTPLGEMALAKAPYTAFGVPAPAAAPGAT